MTGRVPTYLRIVATTRCNYACSYCHMEGDPHVTGTASELPIDRLGPCLQAAAIAGVRKFKFLGGEPFLRRDLADLVAIVRAAAPAADISVITAGVVPTERLEATWKAGLSRVNISIHGFGPTSFRERNGVRGAWEARQRFVDFVLAARRAPVKLNYVWRSPEDTDDLGALLEWASQKEVVVNVLDDLGQDLSWRDLARVVASLRGSPVEIIETPDPDSLPTLHLCWTDGLRVELKHQQLGTHAPFGDCDGCPVRATCKEGIVALRLTHRGILQPCMDRGDLGLPIADLAAASGPAIAAITWRNYVEALVCQ